MHFFVQDPSIRQESRLFQPPLNERVDELLNTGAGSALCLVRNVAAFLLLCLTFVGSFVLNVRNNDFPLSYHEDESAKADQVASDTRNLHHPQLLLETAQWVWRALGRPPGLQATVEIGRAVSAAFASLAAVAAAVTCYRVAGLPGLCVGAAALGTCPALLAYGHYMKEDAALALGVSAVILASHVFLGRRHGLAPVTTLSLGAACGLAASAKFAGAFALVAAAPLVCFAGSPRWGWSTTRIGLLLAGFVVVAAGINHRALEDPRRALSKITDEHRHATTRHVGFSMSRPNAFHAVASVCQTMPHGLVLAGGYAFFVVTRPRRAGAWAVWVLAFALGYLAMLSFSVLPYYRYALPVVVLAHWMMALAILGLATRIPSPRYRAAATFGAVAVVIALQLPRCIEFAGQFRNDSRDRLRLWVMQNLPPDTVIVQDGRVGLDEPFDPRLGIAGRVPVLLYGPASYSDGPAPSAGPLRNLKRMGVEYAAVTVFCFGRYLDPNIRPAPGAAAVFESRRNWYRELFRDHDLVWSSIPLHPTHGHFNNPELRLYRLRDAGAERGGS